MALQNQLIDSACPTIQYRICKEIHQGPSSQPGLSALQDKILQDASVQDVIHSQAPDGWLGGNFHGYHSMESGIRLLCEKGVEAEQPVLAQALLALETHTDRLARGLGKVGKILDDLGLGGTQTIRAHLFAHAGNEQTPLVREQVGNALEAFKFASSIESLKAICEPYRKKLVFRKNVRWPSIYHLRLLARTQRWRTTENCDSVVKSLQNLMRLSPIPDIHIKYKSQLMAPASFCMHHFKVDLHRLSDAEWMQWFHRMELLARLGIADRVPELKQQVETLRNILVAGEGRFTKKLMHPYFMKWGAYTGLALEKDWRTPQRRINDLTFRSLLILQYSNIGWHGLNLPHTQNQQSPQ